MTKKTIKVNFCDFWEGFSIEEDSIYKFLCEHYNVEVSEKPDFLFCSIFGSKHLRYKNCVKILRSLENYLPDFNIYDYAIGCNSMSCGDRYHKRATSSLYMPKLSMPKSPESRKFCNFIYNNSDIGAGAKLRQVFCKKLAEYKTVDCPGKVLNNMQEAIEPRSGNWREGKIDFIKDYKFTIAFENSMGDGYTTEKLVDAFLAHSIPIYWGNKRVVEEFNPKSFINCNEFDSFDEVIEYIKMLDNDDEKYLEMLNQPELLINSEEADRAYFDFIINIIEKGNNPYEKYLSDNVKANFEKCVSYVSSSLHQSLPNTKSSICSAFKLVCYSICIFINLFVQSVINFLSKKFRQ